MNLNVFLPPSSCSGPLPAMIFFHGGSFEEGGSSLFFYNATNLALAQCVVVVTGNYRLGAFGSLFLPVLTLTLIILSVPLLIIAFMSLFITE